MIPYITPAQVRATADPPPPIPAHLRAKFDSPEAKAADGLRFPEPHPALHPSNALSQKGNK